MGTSSAVHSGKPAVPGRAAAVFLGTGSIPENAAIFGKAAGSDGAPILRKAPICGDATIPKDCRSTSIAAALHGTAATAAAVIFRVDTTLGRAAISRRSAISGRTSASVLAGAD